MKTVHIVGLASGPAAEYRRTPNIHVWTMNNYYQFLHPSVKPDRVFQLHVPLCTGADLIAMKRYVLMFQQLAQHYNRKPYPVVVWPDGVDSSMFKRAYPFPKHLLQEFGGAENFGSTISYMLAMAVHEHYTRIRILAMPLLGLEEYIYQRPSLQKLMGRIRQQYPEIDIFCDYEHLWRKHPLPASFPATYKYYHLSSTNDIERQKKELHEWTLSHPEEARELLNTTEEILPCALPPGDNSCS